MKRRSPSDGLVIKKEKYEELKEVEHNEKQFMEILENSKPNEKPEEKVVLKSLEVLTEDKQFERLENIKKQTIEKLIKQQENDKPKHKKKKKVVYVSESEDEDEV